MGGRGGGFKASTSLRPEQLQGLGITGKDMPTSIVAPPPTFPSLQSRPAPLEHTPERDFMIEWKGNFQKYIKDSPYYTSPAKGQSRRTHSRLFYDTSNCSGPFSAFVWPSMPAELRPNWKRKVNTNDVGQKKIKVVNVEETLKALEQKEINGKRKDVDPNAVKEENKSDNEEENVADEEQDDEMDEDNDYGFSYFDNGDDYNDEDDNLDDGPVY